MKKKIICPSDREDPLYDAAADLISYLNDRVSGEFASYGNPRVQHGISEMKTLFKYLGLTTFRRCKASFILKVLDTAPIKILSETDCFKPIASKLLTRTIIRAAETHLEFLIAHNHDPLKIAYAVFPSSLPVVTRAWEGYALRRVNSALDDAHQLNLPSMASVIEARGFIARSRLAALEPQVKPN